METILIALLVGILFLEHGGSTQTQLLAVAQTNAVGFLKYLGSAAVLSLTLSSLPGLLLALYMRSNGFFAYEMFGNQQHSFQILSLNVFLNFLALSIFLFGMALLWRAKPGRITIGQSALGTIAVVSIFVMNAISSGRYDLAASIFILCLLLGGYLYFWVSKGFNGKAKLWWIPLVFSLAFLLVPVICSEGAVILTENALFQMKVGGIDVEVSEPLGFATRRPVQVLAAKLILRTPEFYYLRLGSDPDHVVILRTEHVSLKYKVK